MNSRDFTKLQGLLAKLNAAASKAAQADGSFKKYHTQSIDVLKELPNHLQHIEQGLRTAKIVVD